MKTSWLIGIVLSVHAVAVALLLMSQGCGTSRSSSATSMPPEPVMPSLETTERAPLFPPPVPGTPVALPAAKTTTYVVARGDSLSAIAHRFKLRVADIKAMNTLTDINKLKEGQKLILPGEINAKAAAPRVTPKPATSSTVSTPAPVAGGSYVVKSGDSLWVIARRCNTTVKALKAANNLTKDSIRVGQKLVVPGGTSVPEAARPVAAVEPAPARPVAAPAAKPAAKPAADPVALKPKATEPAPTAPIPEVVPGGITVEVPSLKEPVAAAAAQVQDTAEAAGGAIRIHVVEAEEDLYSVAMMWGVSVADIKRLNGLSDDAVKPGQRLKIPIGE